MNIELYYSTEDIIDAIRSNGFTVKKKKITMSYPVYHNDVDYEGVVVWAVYKDGKEYNKPSNRSFDGDQWIESVFMELLQDKILKLIKS